MAGKRNKIDKQTQDLLKEQLKFLKRFNPQKIILFGSRARGEHLEESDVDLIVVSDKFEGVEFRERIKLAYGLWDKKQDLDIICYTPEELIKRMKQIGIIQNALKEGIEIKI